MTKTDYRPLTSQLLALLGQETDALAATSNFVALLLRTTGVSRLVYLTRETYSLERVSTRMISP